MLFRTPSCVNSTYASYLEFFFREIQIASNGLSVPKRAGFYSRPFFLFSFVRSRWHLLVFLSAVDPPEQRGLPGQLPGERLFRGRLLGVVRRAGSLGLGGAVSGRARGRLGGRHAASRES